MSAAEGLLKAINRKIGGRFDDFLVEQNICPLCGSDLGIRKGEKGCSNPKCGFVTSSFSFQPVFTQTASAKPINELGDGRAQGDTLGRKGAFCVLANSSAYANNKQHLPMSAKWMQIMTTKYDHPRVASMIRLGRQLTHDWGFQDHDRDASILFSNHFGKVLRRIGAYIIITGLRTPVRNVVATCFALSLKELLGEEAFRKAMAKYQVSNDLFEAVSLLDAIFRKVAR